MATAAVDTAGPFLPAPDLNGPALLGSLEIKDKYAEEREKRLGKGMSQYVALENSPVFNALLDDPWIEPDATINEVVSEGGHAKVLIVGAGFGGIVVAVELIKQGFKAEDLLIVDHAGGFGGTWYFNSPFADLSHFDIC